MKNEAAFRTGENGILRQQLRLRNAASGGISRGLDCSASLTWVVLYYLQPLLQSGVPFEPCKLLASRSGHTSSYHVTEQPNAFPNFLFRQGRVS